MPRRRFPHRAPGPTGPTLSGPALLAHLESLPRGAVPWRRSAVAGPLPSVPNGGGAVVSHVTLAEFRDVFASPATHARHLDTWGIKRSRSADAALRGEDRSAVERVDALARELADELPPVPSARRVTRRGDDGDEWDADRLLSGDLDRAALRRVRGTRCAPGAIELVACYGGSWKTTPEQLAWTGVPALVCARLLLDAGYSVGVRGTWAVSLHDSCTGRADRAQSGARVDVLTLLEPGESREADLVAISSVLADERVYRSHGFALGARSNPEICFALGWCHLNPARVYADLAERGEVPEPTWCFDGAYSRDQALTAARNGIRAIVEKLAPRDALDARGAHTMAMESESGS